MKNLIDRTLSVGLLHAAASELLIRRAMQMHEAYKATYACEINEDLAESEKARQILHRHAAFLHHREEAWAGML